MKLRVVSLVVALCVASVGGFGPNSAAAEQAAAKSPATKTEKKAGGVSKGQRLPASFGKLGLSGEQREKVYAVQSTYSSRIEQLKLELQKVTDERDQQIEALLTPNQKIQLKELREAAKTAAAAKKKEGSGK